MSTRVVSNSQVEKSWYVVDVEDKVLGRAATEVARILRGKHKAIYAPSVDTGDFVIIVNADKIRLTGNKMADKMYYRHSGFPGGIKSINAEKLLAAKPEELIKKAVKGMLPKNKLGRQMFKKLKVYAGADHPHQAQQPKEFTL
ncbi:50S ribosomal protein L13 [Geoalkalibacter halelectricus]|uniref:Large ribosomal subunit protein uL13 n=1 Tax=Geoalkalibacter halelectricus TaxID=2847045 RepID=A0ABY5ZHU1_9BACT|nr:50S ribosomal protein L13 [Geoalkalibacter halelectricus]MDO3379421.1 50S ribosomal protein L13 [Geoalkalibacter halelectricus]UWZ78702.1 50S ribosomal protein L13 [Geoalkalibacter halelectricus]